MIEELRNHSHLGSHSQISRLLKLLSKENYSKKDLRLICNDLDYTFSRSFEGILHLLDWLEIIKISNLITLKKKLDHEKIVEDICYSVLNKLAENKELHNFINSHNLIIDQSVLVNNNLIPLKFSALRNLLINLGFFQQDSLMQNHFLIGEKYIDWFNDTGIKLIEKSKLKSFTLERLKKNMERQSELGFEAEKFVLEYELQIRNKHPTCSKIRIISEEDVSAGYDIESYIDDKSIVLDKYIEVKSYSKEQSALGKPYFFWSSNEVEVAEIEEDNYFLYLVDRDQMKNKGYIPTMIKNPYVNVFQTSQWEKECQKWYLQEI